MLRTLACAMVSTKHVGMALTKKCKNTLRKKTKHDALILVSKRPRIRIPFGFSFSKPV